MVDRQRAQPLVDAHVVQQIGQLPGPGQQQHMRNNKTFVMPQMLRFQERPAEKVFGLVNEYAVTLIRRGKAYVCDLTADEVRESIWVTMPDTPEDKGRSSTSTRRGRENPPARGFAPRLRRGSSSGSR